MADSKDTKTLITFFSILDTVNVLQEWGQDNVKPVEEALGQLRGNRDVKFRVIPLMKNGMVVGITFIDSAFDVSQVVFEV